MNRVDDVTKSERGRSEQLFSKKAHITHIHRREGETEVSGGKKNQ